MKTFERILQCRTPEELASIYHKIDKWAIYANGRLLNRYDPSDFIEWLSKESDDTDDVILGTIGKNEKKYPIITLIGSGKFKHHFEHIAYRLTQAGNIVFTPAIFDDPNFFKDPSKITDEHHKIYDEIHRQKMLMSDYVFVINIGGYIGSNTKEEIDYALSKNIKVEYFE